MDQNVFVVVGLILLIVGIAGIGSGVSITSFPQQVTQGDHEVTSGKKISIDKRSTVFTGSDIEGYNITVRNDGSTKLTINVTVRLFALDGTVVASSTAENVVLTGSTYTFEIRFDTVVELSTFDRVEIEAAAS